ncbi:MAG: hypothetical protein H8D87_14555 [Deltaproteobacteria bacterium]|uniref:hypothetical protein n=1 Tax=Desulfobacula sp. TaxID=2593537 RepID=UPI0019BF12B7|nr:hypothetical protein [Candidatus Desulfobacula maris]MBL6996287.1 hypothetical protein [Desulfobacula sp.]
MDFDSIIPLLFVIAFFVLPSLLKQIIARNKKTGTPKVIKKNPSIFDRIGERIQNFVKELEEQARQQRQGITEQNTGWKELAEDEESYSDYETAGEDTDFVAPLTMVPPQKRVPEKAAWPAKRIPSRQKEIRVKERKRNLSGICRYKSNPLQNAIVWSEILSKPIALRDK